MELTRIKSFHPDQMGPLFLGGNLPGAYAEVRAEHCLHPWQPKYSYGHEADEIDGTVRSLSSRLRCRRLETGANNGQGLAFPRWARDPFGRFSSDVPNVSRRFISCSRQSTDRTQRTPHNLLDEFRWSRAFRRRRCRVGLLAIAYLKRLAR